MVTKQDVMKVWQEISNVVPIECKIEVSDRLNGKALKASYQHSKKLITISENINKDELVYVLAHEACHALERKNGPDILVDGDLKELVSIMEDNDIIDLPVGYVALALCSEIKSLAKDWMYYKKTDEHIDYIDLCLHRLEKEKKSGKVKIADFWNWFARNMDKLDNSIDYYQCGGHNDGWLNWRDKLENALEIEIDLAN